MGKLTMSNNLLGSQDDRDDKYPGASKVWLGFI